MPMELHVGDMTCAACVRRVERALARVEGVAKVQVNLATERATVDAPGVGPEGLIEALAQAGYRATLVVDERAAEEEQQAAAAAGLARTRRRVVMAALLTVPIFALEMGPMMIPGGHAWIHGLVGERTLWWWMALLATPVQFGPGWDFYRQGVASLRARSPDMNALVMIGTSAAWSYSMVALLLPGLLPEGAAHVYFEASAVVITLVLLGRYLEQRARGRTSAAVRHLLGLQPRVATRRGVEGWEEVPMDALKVGDLLLVRPGERFAADGVVEEGESSVDRSMLTGEPVPEVVGAGAEVQAATINGAGVLHVRVRAAGQETVLARIVRVVQQAQASQPPVQRLADRVVSIFVPVILVVALATFALWVAFVGWGRVDEALVATVSVLIIACPCAMGLATPTSVMVATGRGAQLGVLFRKGEALERLASVGVVAWDKTGTLTEGAPALQRVVPVGDVTEDEVLATAAAVEEESEHPLARAIVAGARARAVTWEPARATRVSVGQGVEAEVGGVSAFVGQAGWLEARGVGVEASWLEVAVPFEEEGQSVVWVARGPRLLGALVLGDTLRPSAAPALRWLRESGVASVLVTGDAERSARAVAAGVGVEEVYARVSPEGKAQVVASLAAQRGPLAFVGDGINDAPALATADVGVAVGSGTDVAIETGDVVLMRCAPEALVAALSLSRAALRNIRWNLVWAFGYNALLVPVAAGVLVPWWPQARLSPMLAAAAMSVSSVLVVTNALRLRRFRPPIS